MPHELSARVEQLRPIDVSPEAIDKVREVWASDDAEPLGHELIREALDIASTNPRNHRCSVFGAMDNFPVCWGLAHGVRDSQGIEC